MESLLGLAFVILYLLAPVVLFAGIFRQAGYSRWYGMVMLIPLANIIALFLFACREWPISRELARRRLADAEGSDEDAYSVLCQGTELEKHGHWEQALDLYQLVVDEGQGEATQDAARCIQRTRDVHASAS